MFFVLHTGGMKCPFSVNSRIVHVPVQYSYVIINFWNSWPKRGAAASGTRPVLWFKHSWNACGYKDVPCKLMQVSGGVCLSRVRC